MIKVIKKVILFTLVYELLLCNLSLANVNYTGNFYQISDANTTAFLDRSSHTIQIRDLMVMGDSYAVVFSYYNDKSFNFIVHPGYTVKEIYDELLPIYMGQYKYLYLFIGANDFMRQTDMKKFRDTLQEIINFFKLKGTQVILSSYLDPNYNTLDSFFMKDLPIPCTDYDAVVKKLTIDNKLLYIDVTDLLYSYGHMPNDFIHPSESFCKALRSRLYDIILDDQAMRAMPNYERVFEINLMTRFAKYNEEINRVNNEYFSIP